MNIKYMSGAAIMAYQVGISNIQSQSKADKAALTSELIGGAFAELLSQAGPKAVSKHEKSDSASSSEEYLSHLKEKYGIVRIESVSRDQASLDKVGGTMQSGHDVVIAPNMLEKMANDPDKAAEIEGKIDYFFDNIPKYKAEAVAMGLTFESCGCVVHEDGTVTYICGGGDPPERVAEVNEINRKKREKEAAMREATFERGRKAVEERRIQQEEDWDRRRSQNILAAAAARAEFSDENIHFVNDMVQHSALQAKWGMLL